MHRILLLLFFINCTEFYCYLFINCTEFYCHHLGNDTEFYCCYFQESPRQAAGYINGHSYLLLVCPSVRPTIMRLPAGISPEPSRCGDRQSGWPTASRGLTARPQRVMTDALFNDAYIVSIFTFKCGSCYVIDCN